MNKFARTDLLVLVYMNDSLHKLQWEYLFKLTTNWDVHMSPSFSLKIYLRYNIKLHCHRNLCILPQPSHKAFQCYCY